MKLRLFSDSENDGESLHKQFEDMVLSYGTLMTGVDASIIGSIQAEISHASIKEEEKKSLDIIERKISEAEDAMLEPLNSCGEQSNQICSLYLGDSCSNTSYKILDPDGCNLRSQLDTSEHLLIRFELDRAITPMSVLIDPNIKRWKDLQDRIAAGARLHYQLILLADELCYVSGDNILSKLDVNECYRPMLSNFYQALCRETSVRIAIDDPYLNSDSESAEERAMFSLIQLVKNSISHVDFGWCGTHSFTLFLPKVSSQNTRTPYMYQSFMGRHTLQQWFQGTKYQELKQGGLDAYIGRLCDLVCAKNRDEVKKHQMAIFTLGGSDERRMLNNPLVIAAKALRVKFKAFSVDIRLAKRNLNALQCYIDTTYLASSRKTQVDLYKKQAKESMKEHLENLLSSSSKQEDTHTDLLDTLSLRHDR